jgi:transmembrane sensor
VESGWRELSARDPGALSSFERAARIGGLALAVAAVFAVGVVAWRTLGPGARSAGSGAETASMRLPLGDGMEAHYDPGSKLDVRERTTERVVVAMQSGAARFNVRHDPRRLFRVEAGGVVVEDLGTVFAVEHRGTSVSVAVTEGSVAVSFADPKDGLVKRTLAAGERDVFPSTPPAPAVAAAVPSPEPATATPSSDAEKAGSLAPDWRELKRAGKHRRAYELLAPTGFRDVRDEPGDLLLASDVARLSNHPADAAKLLRRLLAGHARDPRAPSAAFTLGWVLMNELGRPREAARAFAQAESLAPRGNLAEDALARAVEAWFRTGDRTRANAELERYRKSYPGGRHLAALERLVRAR